MSNESPGLSQKNLNPTPRVLNETVCVLKREDRQVQRERDRFLTETKPPSGEFLPVDDDGVGGRLVAISAALLVTTPTGRENNTLSFTTFYITSVRSLSPPERHSTVSDLTFSLSAVYSTLH